MMLGTSLTQKTALLPVQTWPRPDVAPSPLGDELLPRPGEGAGALQGAVNVLVAKDGPAHLQPLFEELVVQIVDFWVRRHGNEV